MIVYKYQQEKKAHECKNIPVTLFAEWAKKLVLSEAVDSSPELQTCMVCMCLYFLYFS